MAACFTLILLASVITPTSGCFQCNSKIVDLLGKIRTEALPLQFRESKLRNRCDRLVKGMAGNFFKDYAVKHFTGIIEIHHYNALVHHILTEGQTLLHSKEKGSISHHPLYLDQNFLEAVATFRNQTTIKFKHALKVYYEKACSPTECGWLKMDVFNCRKCKMVKPSCLSRWACMVDEEKRISLLFRDQEVKAAMLSSALSTIGISAFILLIALSSLALMYWMRKKAFIDRTMPV